VPEHTCQAKKKSFSRENELSLQLTGARMQRCEGVLKAFSAFTVSSPDVTAPEIFHFLVVSSLEFGGEA
jgi:hypothetical protein